MQPRSLRGFDTDGHQVSLPQEVEGQEPTQRSTSPLQPELSEPPREADFQGDKEDSGVLRDTRAQLLGLPEISRMVRDGVPALRQMRSDEQPNIFSLQLDSLQAPPNMSKLPFMAHSKAGPSHADTSATSGVSNASNLLFPSVDSMACSSFLASHHSQAMGQQQPPLQRRASASSCNTSEQNSVAIQNLVSSSSEDSSRTKAAESQNKHHPPKASLPPFAEAVHMLVSRKAPALSSMHAWMISVF
jgi:hypothetical protein